MDKEVAWFVCKLLGKGWFTSFLKLQFEMKFFLSSGDIWRLAGFSLPSVDAMTIYRVEQLAWWFEKVAKELRRVCKESEKRLKGEQ